MDDLRRTPLYGEHVREGAKLVPFAGYEMPVQYTSILAECRSVREAAGLFDVSHMGRFRIRGAGALASVQRAVTNDASVLPPGACQYSLLLTEEGGIADDLFVYRPEAGDSHVYLVVNAANAEKDRGMLSACLRDAELVDETGATAMVALQGPGARALVEPLSQAALTALPLHRFTECRIAGIEVLASCTGYTGEDGFELACAADEGPDLWRALRDAGAAPCGLGARDVLRIEAAYPLWGHEISAETLPSDVGLRRFCSKEKGPYVGKHAQEAYAEEGPRRVLVGLLAGGRRFPREGAEVRSDGAVLGRVTSGTFSPSLGRGIAIATVGNPGRAGYRARVQELRDRSVQCGVEGSTIEAQVVGLPFYRRAR